MTASEDMISASHLTEDATKKDKVWYQSMVAFKVNIEITYH